MKRIAITPEVALDDEAKYIVTILDSGWDYVHLRRPSATKNEMRKLIESIPQHYHSQLRLHGHFDLINEFNLGGLHLNHRCPNPPEHYNGSLSCTCHSVTETQIATKYDYITLSPIFDSISKDGYKAAFTLDELKNIPQGKVIALGGVTPDNISLLKNYSFVGFAMLGYLFSSPNLNDLKCRLKIIESKI